MFPKIHVYMTPQQFVFENPKGEKLVLKTIVHVIKEKNRWLLAGIGVDTWEGRLPEAVVIDLFENKHPLPEGINKPELLAAFIGYAVGRSLSYYSAVAYFIFQPTIIFHGIEQFASILHGYEKDILYQAAERAPARKILFE